MSSASSIFVTAARSTLAVRTMPIDAIVTIEFCTPVSEGSELTSAHSLPPPQSTYSVLFEFHCIAVTRFVPHNFIAFPNSSSLMVSHLEVPPTSN